MAGLPEDVRRVAANDWLEKGVGVLLPIAFFCYAYGLRRARVFAVVGQYLEPVFGVAMAVVLFQERWTGWQAVGLVIVVVAMMRVSAIPHAAAAAPAKAGPGEE
jgi:drug/metabolite transporter (DMT)-like permease